MMRNSLALSLGAVSSADSSRHPWGKALENELALGAGLEDGTGSADAAAAMMGWESWVMIEMVVSGV